MLFFDILVILWMSDDGKTRLLKGRECGPGLYREARFAYHNNYLRPTPRALCALIVPMIEE